jgi:hypothetical protein
MQRGVTRVGAVAAIGLAVAMVSGARSAVRAECTDAAASAAVRAEIEAACPCAAATDHRSYVRCAKTVVGAAVAQQMLPSGCASAVRRCVNRSTCGRPAGWVTCCRTTVTGRTVCAVKSSAAKCRAPRGGASCSTGFASCCDACTAGGCALPYTPTPADTASVTPTGTTTATRTITPTPGPATPTATVPALCQSTLGLPALAQVPFTIQPGSSECGGAMLQSPAPAPPLSGFVADASHATIGSLALGCLYPGNFAGLRIPDGSTSKLSVVGINLLPLSLTLAGSDGSGPSDCTRGAGPSSQCANGTGGTDGNGTCTSDADCGQAGACLLKPNCYFGPPIPIPQPIPSCVVNAFETDLCGQVNLVPPQATFATALSSRIYLSLEPDSPCPRCENGVCNSGERQGNACTPVGVDQTSVDCPPDRVAFVGALNVVIPQLTTATSALSAPDGLFCEGQAMPGALGLAAARQVSETGVAPGASSNALAMNLAATFCISRTNTFVDAIGHFPGAGALSVSGQMDLNGVLP